MIEAFEIGISLALQDGVSESISLAQQNLAALEKAVNSSGVALQSLRNAGSRAASIPLVTSRDQPPSSHSTQGVKKAVLLDPVVPTSKEQVFPGMIRRERKFLSGKGDFPTGDSANAAKPNEPPASASVTAVRNTAPSPRHVDRTAGLLVVEKIPQITFHSQPALLSSVAVASEAATDKNPVSPSAASPVLLQMPPAVEQSPISLQQITESRIESTQGVFPQSVELTRFAGLIDNSWSSDPANPARPSFGMSERSTGQSEVPTEGSSIPAAPILESYGLGLSEGRSSRVETPEDDAIEPNLGGGPYYSKNIPRVENKPPFDGQSRAVATQAQRQESQDMKGDVYLDGMLVGRWLSRFLQQQAERAQAGPTGFDAKRGRLLPGVTVGG